MKYLSLFFICFITWSCQSNRVVNLLLKANFETVIDGDSVSLYTISDGQGMIAQVTNYGAKLATLYVPDTLTGDIIDVVAGFDNIGDYMTKERTFGAVMGRYGGRIANGRFVLDEQCYNLHTNKSGHHMHGGQRGFSNVVWEVLSQGVDFIELGYRSPHMEEGYPGNLMVSVRYSLCDNELLMAFSAVTDRPTVINLINHTYFNLNGVGSGDVLDHRLQIDAEYYTQEDAKQIPTSLLAAVQGTVLDFREMKRVGEGMDQLSKGIYDHNYVLTNYTGNLAFAARLEAFESGRVMEVYTNQPGMQFYVRNFKGDGVVGKHGILYKGKGALCLETQHFPNSPNIASFPSTVLRAGEEYQSLTCFRFSGH